VNQTIHVRVVIPVLHSDELVDKCRHEYDHAAGPDVVMSYVCLRHGTSTIESKLDLAIAQPDTIRCCIEAEDEGCDAVVIACFGDPGGDGAKEATLIPIVGEGEAALHFGSLLGSRLSIITVRQETVPFMVSMVERVGMAAKLASVRAVQFGVMDFDLSCVPDVVDQAAAAVTEDGAEVIVMGCTGTGVDMVPQITALLADRVGSYVPVIDPVRAAISLAEGCARHHYRASKRAFPTPTETRTEYWLATERP
jgi:allantoin racemase